MLERDVVCDTVRVFVGDAVAKGLGINAEVPVIENDDDTLDDIDCVEVAAFVLLVLCGLLHDAENADDELATGDTDGVRESVAVAVLERVLVWLTVRVRLRVMVELAEIGVVGDTDWLGDSDSDWLEDDEALTELDWLGVTDDFADPAGERELEAVVVIVRVPVRVKVCVCLRSE